MDSRIAVLRSCARATHVLLVLELVFANVLVVHVLLGLLPLLRPVNAVALLFGPLLVRVVLCLFLSRRLRFRPRLGSFVLLQGVHLKECNGTIKQPKKRGRGGLVSWQ